MANLFFGRAMLQGKEVKRRRVIDEDEFAEIEADFNELKALLRTKPRRRGVPVVGGGTLRPSTRAIYDVPQCP